MQLQNWMPSRSERLSPFQSKSSVFIGLLANFHTFYIKEFQKKSTSTCCSPQSSQQNSCVTPVGEREGLLLRAGHGFNLDLLVSSYWAHRDAGIRGRVTCLLSDCVTQNNQRRSDNTALSVSITASSQCEYS